MSLTDCIKCLDTPCSCGYEYRNWTKERLIEFVASAISYKPMEMQLEILAKAQLQLKENKDK
jgi:hypothetical protein